MPKTKYYAVFGYNAVGVVTYWEKVERSRVFIKGFHIKSFNTFKQAEEYALDKAMETIPYYYQIPERLQCNHIVYLKELKKVHEGGEQIEIPNL